MEWESFSGTVKGKVQKKLVKPTEIKSHKKADYDDNELRQIAKVVGHVHRHLAQRPEGDIEETPWRYSLMNWGHDPRKKAK